MHEYVLFSQVAPARHEQTLHVLAGVTGSQPFAYQDQHLLFANIKIKPPPPPAEKAAKYSKKNPQPVVSQDRLIHDLSRTIDLNHGAAESTGPWRARVPKMPDASVSTFTSRDVTETELDDVDDYKEPTLFVAKGQHYRIGHRFVSGNVIVHIFRIFYSNQELTVDKLLQGPPSKFSDLTILDPSGTYVVEVSIRLEDRNNSKLAEQARAEFLGFQAKVKGVLDLRVPDRFALDTRVKGN